MATVTTNESVLYEQKYNTAFELLAQQMDKRLPMAFINGNYRGSKGARVINQVGPITPRQLTTRNEPVIITDAPYDARWDYPIFFDETLLFNQLDDLQTNADPRSSLVQDAMAGFFRAMDLECIRAFDETSHTGETGTDTTAFPAGNIVAVNQGATANTGLTVAKLREARRLLRVAEVDIMAEQPYIVVGGTQEDNLLAEVPVTNALYNRDAPVLQDGKITRFMGFEFIHSEQLGTNVSGYTKCFAWVRSGMHFGTWQDPTTTVSKAYERRGQPWQAYVLGGWGATRVQEKKVIEILCA